MEKVVSVIQPEMTVEECTKNRVRAEGGTFGGKGREGHEHGKAGGQWGVDEIGEGVDERRIVRDDDRMKEPSDIQEEDMIVSVVIRGIQLQTGVKRLLPVADVAYFD